MKGESDCPAAPPMAGTMAEKTQGKSHANRSAQRFFSIFDFPSRPKRMQSCLEEDTSPAVKMKNNFSKIACHAGTVG